VLGIFRFKVQYRDRHKFNQFSTIDETQCSCHRHTLFYKSIGWSFTIGLSVEYFFITLLSVDIYYEFLNIHSISVLACVNAYLCNYSSKSPL
jgi:hypothetical protein